MSLVTCNTIGRDISWHVTILSVTWAETAWHWSSSWSSMWSLVTMWSGRIHSPRSQRRWSHDKGRPVTVSHSEACIEVTWSSLTNQRPVLLLTANHSGVFQETSWCSSVPPAPRSPSSSSYTGGQHPAPRYQDVYAVSSDYGPKVSVTETYFAYWVKKAQKVLIEDSPDQMWLRPTVAHWKRHPQLSCTPGDGGTGRREDVEC